MSKNELKTRKIASIIIKNAHKTNKRLNQVSNNYLNKEGKDLNNKEKRFITMLVQGTVRMIGRLDREIKNVFIGDYDDL